MSIGTLSPRSNRTASTTMSLLTVGVVVLSFAWQRDDDTARMVSAIAPAAVHARFDLSTPAGSPFPTNRFTVADADQNTDRRINLPLPDCGAAPDECDDIAVLNTLDGFNVEPRVSIPFDGDIDLRTVSNGTVFLVSVPDSADGADLAGAADRGGVVPTEELLEVALRNGSAPRVTVVGLNQIVWDAASHTLHGYADRVLDQHARYAVVVTRGVRDTSGAPIDASAAFKDYRDQLAGSPDPVLRWYRGELLRAEHAARLAGVRRHDLAVISLFSTQSVSATLERIRDQLHAATPAPATFTLGPAGERTVYPLSAIRSIAYRQQTGTAPAFVTSPVSLALFDVVPGAVGRIAFGRFTAPDYLAHPTEHIPAFASRTGAPAPTGTVDVYFHLFLPAGPAPAGGWPVAVVGHPTTGTKQGSGFHVAVIQAAHGIATLVPEIAAHGFGPLSTLTVTEASGAATTFAAGGRGVDQDGDGEIGNAEGMLAARPYQLVMARDSLTQQVADLLQLVRVLQVGVDADGDGAPDLDPGRIYYVGHSLGSQYGVPLVAVESEIRAAVFNVAAGPLVETRRLAPAARGGLGLLFAARTPSLLNAPGLTSLDGLAVAEPYWNENLPLRDQAPVRNEVGGAVALQTWFDRSRWAARSSDPAAFARFLRQAPLAGAAPRPVIFQLARGDQATANPTNATLLRNGDLADRATFYRHDLAWAEDPTRPTNPHNLLGLLGAANMAPVSRGAHEQIATFFASDGAATIHPEPARFFETPIASLREDLGFIP